MENFPAKSFDLTVEMFFFAAGDGFVWLVLVDWLVGFICVCVLLFLFVCLGGGGGKQLIFQTNANMTGRLCHFTVVFRIIFCLTQGSLIAQVRPSMQASCLEIWDI